MVCLSLRWMLRWDNFVSAAPCLGCPSSSSPHMEKSSWSLLRTGNSCNTVSSAVLHSSIHPSISPDSRFYQSQKLLCHVDSLCPVLLILIITPLQFASCFKSGSLSFLFTPQGGHSRRFKSSEWCCSWRRYLDESWTSDGMAIVFFRTKPLFFYLSLQKAFLLQLMAAYFSLMTVGQTGNNKVKWFLWSA